MTASLRKHNFSLGDESSGYNKGMYETGTYLHGWIYCCVFFLLIHSPCPSISVLLLGAHNISPCSPLSHSFSLSSLSHSHTLPSSHSNIIYLTPTDYNSGYGSVPASAYSQRHLDRHEIQKTIEVRSYVPARTIIHICTALVQQFVALYILYLISYSSPLIFHDLFIYIFFL